MSDQPERLYGLPGAEHMQLDISTCYESDIEPDREDGDNDAATFTIEEWTTAAPRTAFPSVDHVIQRIIESYTEDFADEDCYNDFVKAGERPEVEAMFDAALDALCSHVSYRMAERHVADHTVTFNADGEPLLNGQPMYIRRPT